jgi:AraC-like DNA-binding protein
VRHKNHHTIIFLLIVLFNSSLFGQLKENDLTKLSYKEIRKKIFDNPNKNIEQSLYTNAYITKAKNEKNNLEIARGYFIQLLSYSDNKQKLQYLDTVIKYSKNVNDKNFPAKIYAEKAYLLQNEFKYQAAIDNFILAEKYAIKNNIDFYYNVRQNIAILKSENLGEVEEAMSLYHECYKYYKTKDYRSKVYNPMYLEVLFDIADAHKALFKSDSATYYNKLGYIESKITKATPMQNLFILNEGANLVIKKNYPSAIDSINKALPAMIADKDIGNTLASYYYLGKAYQGMHQKKLALINFIKVDSIYKIKKEITPEFVSGYPFIISYYKDKGDKIKQLEYLTSYMTIDSLIHKNYKELTKKLEKEYDRPYFMKEKDVEINALKGNQYYFIWGIVLLLLLVFGAMYYSIYQRKLNKTYREKFEKIVANTPLIANPIEIEKEIPEQINKNRPLIVGDELAKELLEKLDEFEKAKGYLKSDITLQSLSNEMETNSTYLSKIINQHKGKGLVTYLNDLRIDTAVKSLQQNHDLKKFTIQAIANEFGFNNAESFSTAFYKRTGLKPSFFIKELAKKNSV